MVAASYAKDGYAVFDHDPRVLDWAQAAYREARNVIQTPGDLRHGKTWRVGVDELPNAPDGAIAGVALKGPWESVVTPPATWHRAQVSIVYAGYPQQDVGETDAAHRYRLRRDAAHVDGLLPEGPDKRRHVREPHRFILGLPLNAVFASPLVVWRGSHVIMQAAFARAFEGIAPQYWGDLDVTEAYQTARREVFEHCTRVEVAAVPGQATLLHRHLVHGVAPWGDAQAKAEGRMIAYFRPVLTDIAAWV